jgi:type III secretion protein U
MSGADSERKHLPASPAKLRKAREKGQVMSSEQFVSGMTFLACILTLVFLWKGMVGGLAGLFEASLIPTKAGDSANLILKLYESINYIILYTCIFFGVFFVAVVLSNIIHKGGIFSVEPIAPKGENMSLSKGFKRMTDLKNWTEFGSGFLRIVIWSAAALFVMYFAVSPALNSVQCGLTCQFSLMMRTVATLLVIATIILIVIGITDLPLQKFLFLHEMRMGDSEAKRDSKESNGDPLLKSARKDLGRSFMESAQATAGGSKNASVVLIGNGVAVALRYDPVKHPVPIVIAKGMGPSAVRIISSARQLNLLTEENGELTARLYKDVQLGNIIQKKHFDAVAMILVKNNVNG